MARFRNTLLATTALMPLGIMAAAANPLGSQVVGGTANVQGQGTSTVTVTQSTPSAIINWKTFNIGNGETTQFVQPNSSSVTLNRVTGNLGASVLDGTLTANGKVFLVNPDGILFGAGSKINTGSFLATTNDIGNADFMAGRYQFNIPGRPDASIVNLGTITATNGGFAALVAPGVRNTGTITATLGTIGLVAGNSFSLDFYGDRLITLGVNDSIAAKVIDVATGQPLNALVQNDGKLKANGGRVELTAAAARQVVDSVINNTGVIEADSIGTKNGMIVLGAATDATKPAGAPTQTIKLSGTISAAGKRKNTKGGTIVATGENIQLASVTIDASGQAGGGKVLIGGDVGGGRGNPAAATIPMATLESFAVPTASNVSVDAATTINASAIATGNGGKVVVWSDQATTFYGTIKARGGSQSGSGGFVETSGHQSLTFNGLVDTKAPYGANGTLLLDPLNVTIGLNAGTGVMTASSVENALANGNVFITTNVGGNQLGNITVATPVAWSSSNTLSLNANNSIAINAAITGLNGGLTLIVAGPITATAAIDIGTFTLQSGSWSQVTPNLPSFTANDFRIVNGTFVRALSGDGTAAAPYQITDVYGLQGIGSSPFFLNSNWLLANNIIASGTADWNAGSGFIPIGQQNGPFSGLLDGQGHTIQQLVIKSSAQDVGLFDTISSGTVRNLGLTNINVISTSGYGNPVGALAAFNSGTIDNVSATGSVSFVNGSVGGLVGENGTFGGTAGLITNSNANVTVTGGTSGGLAAINFGKITNSFATGSVFADGAAGGLVGSNGGYIINSHATGSVIGNSNSIGWAGGLACLIRQKAPERLASVV